MGLLVEYFLLNLAPVAREDKSCPVIEMGILRILQHR